jgi:Zn-dependent protease with chaperone function
MGSEARHPADPAGAVPDRVRERFPGISPRAYEHPADRSALVALRKLGGFDAALKVMAGAFRERSLRLVHLASAVRVGPTQFGELHDMVTDAARALDLVPAPEVYVLQNPAVNAMTLGIDRPWIVVTTGALDLFDDEELRFLIGREVGHILSGHGVYRTMLFQLVALAERVAWIPIGGWGLRAVVFGLEEWQRSAELSGDRAGLLVGQDVGAALRVHMKTAGGSRLRQMDAAAFLAQAEDYASSADPGHSIARVLNLVGRSQPFAVHRAAELRGWVVDGSYARILVGDYPRRVDDASVSWREEVAETIRAYRDRAETSSDPLVGFLRDVATGAGDSGRDVAARLRDRFTRPRL